MKLLFIAGLLLAATLLLSESEVREQLGPQRDGSVLLSTGWKIRPAGKQVPVGTFPMSMAQSKDGKHLLVLNGGYNPPSISVLDAASATELGRTPVADGWLGLTFTPNGRTVYVGGGAEASVFEYKFEDGKQTPTRVFTVVPKESRAWQDFIGDVQVSPDGRLLYATNLYRDQIEVINPQSGMVIEHYKTGRRPYRILFAPDGKSYFVSSWADGSIYQHSVADGSRLGVIRAGLHPTDMLLSDRVIRSEGQEAPFWKSRLFVAAANTNSVFVYGVSEAGTEVKQLETINIAMSPMQPVGSTPSALALSGDQKTLYVVCSDVNAVAVVDISDERAAVRGFVPTGWYPTAARSLADGRLVVLNGRGLRSFPNPNGPNPARKPEPVHQGVSNVQFVGRMQTGTVAFVDPFDEAKLEEYTKTVIGNSAYRDAKLYTPPAGIPKEIKHVIYIVKENRTYDQVFGDEKRGNGDASLTLFTEQVGPNHRKLAREFVLFDNFYVVSDVSADGHNWSTAAIAPDYVQKMWPNSYGKRRKHYDYEEGDPAALPPAGYLWTNAASAGKSVRNYGYTVDNKPQAAPTGEAQITGVRDSVLRPVTNFKYRGFDLNYPDVDRAKIFLEDLAGFEQSGQMPDLIVVRLGNDHTSGTAAGKIAPLSAFADNDLALGQIVEAISKSKFWASTAIFVLEDDAQNGPDHVDSHRSPAFVISPYTRRGVVDSTLYNTTSMLRTMEGVLGLRPMTVFDAGSRVMSAAFGTTADVRPYQCEKARIALDQRNPAGMAGVRRPALDLDLDEEDRVDDAVMNAMLWQAIRGTEAPAPVRSFFAR